MGLRMVGLVPRWKEQELDGSRDLWDLGWQEQHLDGKCRIWMGAGTPEPQCG